MPAFRSLSVALAAGVLVTLASLSGPLAATAAADEPTCQAPCPPAPPPPAVPVIESPAAAVATMVTSINRERVGQGLAPLSERADLDAVASGWSHHLADTGVLAHNDAYFLPASRQRLGAQALGENVALNATPEAAHAAFMASPHHRDNVLDARFTAVGIGAEWRGGSWWITEDFLQGATRPVVGAAAAPAAAPAPRPPAPRPPAPAPVPVRATVALPAPVSSSTTELPPPTTAVPPPTPPTVAPASGVTSLSPVAPTAAMGPIGADPSASRSGGNVLLGAVAGAFLLSACCVRRRGRRAG